MFMICLHTKLQMPTSSFFRVINITLKTKDSFMAAILIFCTPQKCYLNKSLFVCIFQGSKPSGANVTYISEVLLKIILIFFNGPCVYFVWPLEYLIKKPLVPTKWEKIVLIEVKSCNKMLLTLLIYISISLTSVMGFKFLILGACHLATLYLREKGCEVPWLLFKAKGGLQAKTFGKQC
jgi:hypothetical protein